jgi:tRNA(Met) C34 N-acetyltransferase TmcA
MAIYRLLQDSAFQPDDIKRMADAYEHALILLHLDNRRDDPLTETVAQYIIEIAQTGEQHSETICDIALKRLHKVEAA